MKTYEGWLIAAAMMLAALIGPACITTTPTGGSAPPADAANEMATADAVPANCVTNPGFCGPGTRCVNGTCEAIPVLDASSSDAASNPRCTPGEPRSCSFASCTAGTAYCNDMGTAFGACSCPPPPDAGPADSGPAPDVMVSPDVASSPDVVPMDGSVGDTGFTCPPGQSFCAGRCVDGIAFAGDINNCGACGRVCTPSAGGMVSTCVSGFCGSRCAPGFADCDLNPSNGCETNTIADFANCGACNRACRGDQVCAAGACMDRCPSGQSFCGGACVNVQVDNAHCGACGRACSIVNGSGACASGACTVAVCNSGFGDCDGTASNGCETNTNVSDRHCGRCGNMCPAGQTCNGSGRCVSMCPAGQTFCAGACVDISTDENNCGGCGTVCSGGTVCLARACTGLCPLGRQVCTVSGIVDACVDFATDLRHCGGCGRVCSPFGVNAAQCVAGNCGFNRCLLGLANCDGNDTNGCETDLYSSSNCGACGHACPSRTNASSFCSFEQSCAFTCNGGFGNCDGNDVNGCETNTRTSLTHCGGCGRACLTGRPHMTAVCATGTCDYVCDVGFADCDGDPANGCEVDVRTDTNNCGRCSTRTRPTACASGQVCSAGVCTSTGPSCGAGVTNCSGVCTNTQSDATNCGACGRVCATGQTCVAGVCSTVSCAAGLTPCGGTCVDTQNDPMNCGSCGGRCAGGLVCSRGVCNLPDAGVDATADASDVTSFDVGTDVMPTDVVVTGFGLFIRPASGTAATSPTGGTMSFVTAQRSVLVPRTWLAGGAEAIPAASPGGVYNVSMTPGYAVVKYYIGGAEQDLCSECRINGRCTAAALGYVDGDIRVRGNPYLSPVGEDVNGRIVPVSQVFVRRDPYNPSSITCALVIGINQLIDATAPGAAP